MPQGSCLPQGFPHDTSVMWQGMFKRTYSGEMREEEGGRGRRGGKEEGRRRKKMHRSHTETYIPAGSKSTAWERGASSMRLAHLMFSHTEFLCEEGTRWTLLFTMAGVGHCGKGGKGGRGGRRGRGRERGMKGNRGKKGKRGEMINTRLQVHNSSV